MTRVSAPYRQRNLGTTGLQVPQRILDVLAVNYGCGLRLLDFISEPEQSRITINDWVSDQTENKIKDLIPQGVIDDLTRLVLDKRHIFQCSLAGIL